MNMGLILRKILILIMFFSVVSQAAVLDTDTFDSNLDGWTGAGVTRDAINSRMFINRDNTASKTFALGAAYANKTVTIKMNATKTNNWDGTDLIQIYANGTRVYNSNTGGALTLSGTTNATGQLSLTIMPNTNDNVEDLYIDNISIEYTDTSSGASNFPLRYSINLMGNMKVIGNTVLCPKINGQCVNSTAGTSNASVDLRYVDVDGDGSTFNSSSAVLADSAILTPTAAKVKWAGLYWSGYLSNSTYTQAAANALITTHTVKLSIAGGNYIDISSHTVLGKFVNNNYYGTSYGCFADVTTHMQGADPRGTYRVANIPSTQGETNSHGDGLGNSGAWTLVVIYENNSVGEKTRNATVFDGFIRVYDVDGNSNNGMQSANDVNINLSGFRTPKSGTVDSTLSVFANEGDRYIPSNNADPTHADQLKFTNTDGDKNTQSLILSSDSGTYNYFDSSITGVDTRSPNIANNNGIDIHTDELDSIIGTNQTKAQITLTTAQDTYFPVMVAFTTELARPNICYDYTAVLDNQMVPLGSSDLTFNPYVGGSELTAKVFIRSLESDFDLQNTALGTHWSETPVVSPATTFSYQNGFIQPPLQYQYDLAIPIAGTTETISIGRNNSATGGLLGRQESIYANMNYLVSNIAQKTIKLDINVTGGYSLDPANPSVLTPFKASTREGNLPKCDGNVTYNPRWLNFNIERSNAGGNDYNLYTQVTGLPYDLKIVSYSASNILINDANQLTTPIAPLGNIGLEAELFEIPQFESLSENQGTMYDRVCEDSSNAKPWQNNQRKFIIFPNTTTSIPFPVAAGENKYAIRNAAVRIWMLLRPDKKTIVHHGCTDTNGTCFKDLYANNYDDNNYSVDGKCGICVTGTEEACYSCLKRYYGQPVCSRDNFAIRPDGIKLTVGDNGVELSNNYKNTPPEIHLASGYDYNVSFAAKNADGTDTQGYYMHGIPTVGEIAYKVFSVMQQMSKFFGLLFDTATGSSCADTNHTSMDYYTKKFTNHNVGKYNLYYVDNDWTLVDHGDYVYKTRLGWDCLDRSTAQSINGNIPGCATSSMSVDATGAENYSLLPMRFHPHHLNLSGVNMTKIPNNVDDKNKWVYMNNINDTIEANAASMAVAFQGNIAAMNANPIPTVTTNFTDGCAAENLDLNLSYTSNDFNASLTKPIVATNIETNATSMVGMQYRLQSAIIIGDANNTNGDANNTSTVRFNKALFTDAGEGNATIDLRYNIEKVLDKVVNPLVVMFQRLGAMIGLDSSSSSNISAIRDNNHRLESGAMVFRPKGVQDYDNNVTFLYARVYTLLEEGSPPTTATDVITRFKILAYCKKATLADCGIYKNDNNETMFTRNNADPEDWYAVNTHPGNTIINYRDYGVIQNLNLQAGSSARVNPNQNIPFDLNGTTGSVTISHPVAGRTHVAHVSVVPDLWLKYHVNPLKNGNPWFDLTFQQASQDWAGVGVTGNVINKNTTTQNAKNRLSW